jgi:hypothetical protein
MPTATPPRRPRRRGPRRRRRACALCRGGPVAAVVLVRTGAGESMQLFLCGPCSEQQPDDQLGRSILTRLEELVAGGREG